MATHAPTTSDTSPKADQVAHYPAISIVDLARRHCALDEFYRDVDRANINHFATYGDARRNVARRMVAAARWCCAPASWMPPEPGCTRNRKR